MHNDINIFSLGGQDENGKNCHVIEIDKEIFVVNVGLKYPINSLYGIDRIIPDFDYLQKNKKNIKGIFITQAHDEMFAGLSWLLMVVSKLTIFASKYTYNLIKERISKYNIGLNQYDLQIIKPVQQIGQITVKSFEIASSIPGSLAYNFQTNQGDIIFIPSTTIGDLGAFGKTDLMDIKNNSNSILALFLDSYNSSLKGFSFDKKSIKPHLENIFKDTPPNERIIVGAYDEEVYTINEVLELSIKYNRPVILYGSAFNSIYKNMTQIYKVAKPIFKDHRYCNQIKNAVIFITSTWERLYQRFERIAHNKDVNLKFMNNDHIIMLAPPKNGMEVLYANSLDEVAKVVPDIFELSQEDVYKLRATSDDIKIIVNILKPKYFFPIYALYRYLVEAGKAANNAHLKNDKIIVLQNGKIVHFQKGDLISRNKMIKESGDIIIDGFGVGDVSYEVVKERQTLATGGLISASFQFDIKNLDIKGKIETKILGIVTDEELPNAKKIVQSSILKSLDKFKSFDYRELQNKIKKDIRKSFLKFYDKSPLIIIIFCEI